MPDWRTACYPTRPLQRGLDCLSRFAQLLGSVDIKRVRVVGTNALRMAKNRKAFTGPAKRILGTRVDVIYGLEEARLVYLGVAHSLADDAHSRLVIDIGGGSTEFIIGQRFEPQFMESLQMGCVSYGKTFFPKGRISRDNFRNAYNQARAQTVPIRHRFPLEALGRVRGFIRHPAGHRDHPDAKRLE